MRRGIHAWIYQAAGLPDTQVIWTDQGAPRPASGPWISLALIVITPIGRPWEVFSETSSPTPNADLNRTQGAQRNALLSVQVFGASATDAGGPSGMQIIDNLSLATYDDGVRLALRDLGVSVLKIEATKAISGVINSTTFEPRAVVEIRLLLNSERTTQLAEIRTAEVTDEERAETITISVDA